MIKQSIVVGLMVILVGAASAAEDVVRTRMPLSLSQAIERAFEHSTDLKINDAQMDQLMNKYHEVHASIFPNVEGSVEVINYIESPVLNIDLGMGPKNIPIKQQWEASANATLTQVIWAFGKVFTAIELAENAVDVQKGVRTITQNELRYATTVLYYTYVMSDEVVRIAEESYENAQKNEKVLNARYKGGRISQVNNIKMQADVAARIPAVMQAKANRAALRAQLNDLLQLDDTVDITLVTPFDTSFPVYDRRALMERMIENAPVLETMRRRVALQKNITHLRKIGYYPTIGGYLSYGYSGNADTMVPDMQNEIVAGINISCTLWDNFAKWNTYKQAKNEESIVRMEYDKKVRALIVQLEEALSKYELLQKTYQANCEAEKLAAESYAITLASFKSGAVSQTMLNDAERMLSGAKMETLTTLYTLHVLMARIEKLADAGENL